MGGPLRLVQPSGLGQPAHPVPGGRPEEGGLAQLDGEALTQLEAAGRFLEVADLGQAADPDEGGPAPGHRVLQSSGDLEQLGRVGQPLGEGGRRVDGVVAGEEHTGQGGGVAEPAGRGQGLVRK